MTEQDFKDKITVIAIATGKQCQYLPTNKRNNIHAGQVIRSYRETNIKN